MANMLVAPYKSLKWPVCSVAHFIQLAPNAVKLETYSHNTDCYALFSTLGAVGVGTLFLRPSAS